MKTLLINGLTFTDQPPTKEGWWLWMPTHSESDPVAIKITCYADNPYAKWGGFWHELIPRQVFAEEVEKAYLEGWRDCSDTMEDGERDCEWEESRAKRAAEGKEPK